MPETQLQGGRERGHGQVCGAAKEYEKWEKGKKMLAVDELNKLKRSHQELQDRVSAAKAWVETQYSRRAGASAAAPEALKKGPSAATAAVVSGAASGTGRGKAAGPKASGPAVGGVRGGGPAVRTGPRPGGGGYASAPAVPAAALRQAQLASQLRTEDFQAAAEVEAMAPRPRPPPRREEGPPVVLSYSCTVAAVAEHLGISEDKARDLADSSSGFAKHLQGEAWARVQERSLAIEKEKKEAEKEKEKRRQEKALRKVDGTKDLVAAVPPKGAPPGMARAGAVPKPKPKPAPALAPKKKGATDGLSHPNRSHRQPKTLTGKGSATSRLHRA